MQKIKTLHIASFIGNVGDNANHIGAEFLRKQYLDFEFDIDCLEIREFYWKEWAFNTDEFINMANKYDLIMIGGGNYFELWVEGSNTGTSIDISLDTLERINTPFLFYGLGCDDGQGIPKGNAEKFDKFLDYLKKSSKGFVTVRNDGAYELIQALYKNKYDDFIVKIPDGGFFTQVPEKDYVELKADCKNIIINIAGDMLEKRFPGKDCLDYSSFSHHFSEYMIKIFNYFNEEVHFIFANHIFRDMYAVYEIMDRLPDKIRRSNVSVLPYVQKRKGHDYIFGAYKKADLVLGTRFHANVCPIGMGIHTIGLINYPQVRKLYRDLVSEDFVMINQKSNFEALYSKSIQMLNDSNDQIAKNLNYLDELSKNGYLRINDWLLNKYKGGKNDN